jgi:histidinol dehydrogenase
MIRRIDLRGAAADGAAPVDYRAAVPRAEFDVEAATQVVRPICDAVRDRGVEAILEYGARFDGVDQTDIAVPGRRAARRRWRDWTPTSGRPSRSRSVGSASPARPSSSTTWSPTSALAPASATGWSPVQRVGLYVPGGLAPLVSSVV